MRSRAWSRTDVRMPACFARWATSNTIRGEVNETPFLGSSSRGEKISEDVNDRKVRSAGPTPVPGIARVSAQPCGCTAPPPFFLSSRLIASPREKPSPPRTRNSATRPPRHRRRLASRPSFRAGLSLGSPSTGGPERGPEHGERTRRRRRIGGTCLSPKVRSSATSGQALTTISRPSAAPLSSDREGGPSSLALLPPAVPSGSGVELSGPGGGLLRPSGASYRVGDEAAIVKVLFNPQVDVAPTREPGPQYAFNL